jgi:hypothetical protein
VAEATHCGHRSKLPALFASSTFCNAMAAVCAGIVGHAAVEWNTPHVEEGAAAVAIGSAGVGVMGGGEGESAAPANMYTLPFDVAVPVLLGCSMGALVWWREHRGGVYGGVMAPSGGVIPVGSIRQAYNEISKGVYLLRARSLPSRSRTPRRCKAAARAHPDPMSCGYRLSV